MFLHATVLLTLALGAEAGPGAPRAASATKYHLAAVSENTLDLSGVGGPTQVTNQTLDAWITMTLTDSAGGRVVHVVVDSARVVTDNPQAVPGEQEAAKGAVIHGFQDPAGRVKNLTSSLKANTVVASIQGALNGLFPRVRGNAKAGDRWVDTTEVANPGEGNNTTATLITAYNAGAAESVEGAPGIRVDATSTATVGGSLSNPQAGTIEVAGVGTGTGTFVVGRDGRLLGGKVNSSQELKLTVAMAPAPLPLKVVQSLVVTLLK
jgi:hypothetical protein